MDTDAVPYEEELRKAVAIAEEAGALIDQYTTTEYDTGRKEDGTSITEVDIESQRRSRILRVWSMFLRRLVRGVGRRC